MDTITSINSSTNAVISGSDYAVNAIGQCTGITRSGSATPGSASAGYIYNNRGELITADEATNAMDRAYQYDGIGNREKSANSLTLPGSNNFTVNALNQYTAVNLGTSVSPVHDDDGNATAYPLPVNLAANAALTYDGENRLIKVITGSTTVEYIYDAFSRRVAKTVGSTRTYYIYDGWNCVAEFTGAVHTSGTAPALTRTFTHTWGLDLSGSMQGAGGVGGLLQTTAHGSLPTHHYPVYDGNGNITAYIDNSCAVQASFDYDPFGNITNGNNTLNLPYSFSTKPRDLETGLYYYGYRFYDPATGRWINRDPIQESGGDNLHAFVENKTISRIEYLGLAPSSSSITGVSEGGKTFTVDHVAPTPTAKITCSGVCGADITDWFIDEVNEQMFWWDFKSELFRTKHGTNPGYYQFAWWSYQNHHYKPFFPNRPKFRGSVLTFGRSFDPQMLNEDYDKGVPFSDGVFDSAGNQCGAIKGCGQSVTLCNKCIPKSVLGNLMFGMMLKYSGINFDDASKYVEGAKLDYGMTRDVYDPPIFAVGYDSMNVLNGKFDAVNFCSRLAAAEKTWNVHVNWLTKGGTVVHDLSGCVPCDAKTKYTKHSGQFHHTGGNNQL